MITKKIVSDRCKVLFGDIVISAALDGDAWNRDLSNRDYLEKLGVLDEIAKFSGQDLYEKVTQALDPGEIYKSAKTEPANDSVTVRQVVDDTVTLTDHTNDPKLNFTIYAEEIVKFADEIPQRPAPDTRHIEPERWWSSWNDFTFFWFAIGTPPGGMIHEDELPLLSFGIHGPWGAGKSTLIQPIKRKFEERGYFVAVINPWKWDGKGDLHDFVRNSVLKSAAEGVLRGKRRSLARRVWFRENRLPVTVLALMLGIVAAIYVLWDSGSPILLKLEEFWAKAIGGASLAVVLLGTIWKLFGEAVSAFLGRFFFGQEPDTFGATALNQAYRDVAKLMREARRGAGDGRGKPIVVIFDDLDRCSPDRVVEFVESVHSLVSAGAIVFVACDADYVAAALSAKHKAIADHLPGGSQNFGRRFLEKIIQVRIQIPNLEPEGLSEIGITAAAPTPRAVEVFGQDAEPRIDVDQVEVVAGSDGGADAYVRSETDPNTNPDAKPDPAPPADEIDEIKLTEVAHDVLREATIPLSLNVRQAKSLSNTLKLQMAIRRRIERRDHHDQPFNEEDARRFAAFLLANAQDPHWLDAWYMNRNPVADEETADPLRDGPIARDDTLRGFVEAWLGDDRGRVKPLYALVGRRPGG